MSLRQTLNTFALVTTLSVAATNTSLAIPTTTGFGLSESSTLDLRLQASSLSSDDAQTPRRPGLGKRNAGIVLTSLGAATAATGLGFIIGGLVADTNNCGPDGTMCDMGGALITPIGAVMAGVATPMLATGIPLWVVGNRKMKSGDPVAHLGFGATPKGKFTLSLSGTF